MTHTSKTIIFFGSDEFSAASLRELIVKGFSIGAVVTKPDSRKGRGRELSKSVVKEIAEANDIPVLQPDTITSLAEHLNNVHSPIGVLVSYGKIIPQSIIDLFTPGIINVHPSLLPLYRGPSPVESVILNGDTQTGVTIMQLSAKMDAGPIYHQLPAPLLGTETAPELEAHLAELGAQQLCAVLPSIVDGSLQPTPQNDDVATYCKLLTKDQSILDTQVHSAEQAERQVRAFLAFPKTKVTVADQPIVITKAHISDTQATVLDLPCADGRFLSIDEMIGPSGKKMNAKAFINGYIQ